MQMTNRTACPRCTKQDTDALTDQKQALLATYGQATAQDFVQQALTIARSERRMERDFPELLREDIEIGVVGASFVVDYRAKCSNCGFGITFKRSVDALTAGS